jgi:hypothetical protein
MYKNIDYSIEKINFNTLHNTILNSSKYFSNLICPLFIDYQKEFHKKSFFNGHSFKIKTDNNTIFIAMTIETIDGIRELNFYNYPIIIYSSNKISELDNNIIKKILINFGNDYKISKYKICFKKKIELNKNLHNNFFLFCKKIFINLSDSKEKIFMNFKPNLRNELRKNYGIEPLQYRLVDYNNYKDEVHKMKKLHKEIVGFQTRSDNSWLINEKMIMNKKAFLLEVTLDNEIISYSLFHFTKTVCNYFSSCTRRDMFKIHRNINHKSIWSAIQYAANKAKFFFIGDVKIFSKEILTEKEKNIGFFFSRFNEPKNNYYYADNLNYVDFT